MKIGIVGPISKDSMILPDGNVEPKWGAVAYSALAIAKLLNGSKDLVVCLSHLSPEDINEVRAFLDHPNIIIPDIDTADTKGTKIELRHIDNQERVSRQMQTMTPVSPKEMKLLADCDYLILMPLNENDIPLGAVKEFRQGSRALIFLDVHGLITGVDSAGKRYKKGWEQSHKWIETIDFLKMNDKEAPWAAGRFLKEQEDYARFAGSVIDRGLSACWITFGDQSSLIAWRRNERVFWAYVPVVDVGKVVDTIGCGDTASAGFIYSYAKMHNPLLAVVLGNVFGSVKASLSAINEFPSKPEVRGMVYQHYRHYLHTVLDEFLTQDHLIVHEVKEDHPDESSLHSTDGHRYDYGTDHAGGGDRQGSPTPGPWGEIFGR
ncbi:MAG: carbohydrate kinase family protein [Negativicutes bacterium]|nr:carbohydrate kinase family protein [Negativicutes bacterium]